MMEQCDPADKPSSNKLTTLLFQALESQSSIEMVSYLVSSGANVNALHNGKTPLMTVATGTGLIEKLMQQQQGEQLVQLLLDAGADINRTSYECKTALTIARFMQKQKIETMLLDMGASPDAEQRCQDDLAHTPEPSADSAVAKISPSGTGDLDSVVGQTGLRACICPMGETGGCAKTVP